MKAQGLPLNLIVLGVIAALVLSIVIAFTIGGAGTTFGKISKTSVAATGGEIESVREACRSACDSSRLGLTSTKDWAPSAYCAKQVSVDLNGDGAIGAGEAGLGCWQDPISIACKAQISTPVGVSTVTEADCSRYAQSQTTSGGSGGSGGTTTCSGTPTLTISPTSGSAGITVAAGISGFSGCDGIHASISSDATCLNSANVVGSCTISGLNCGTSFSSPPATTTYYACVDKNNNGQYTSGEVSAGATYTYQSSSTGSGGTTDTTPPTVTASYSPVNPTTTSQITVTTSATDYESGVSETSVYVDGLRAVTCSSAMCTTQVSMYPVGTHTYYGTAKNGAGLTGQTAQQSFTVQQKV